MAKQTLYVRVENEKKFKQIIKKITPSDLFNQAIQAESERQVEAKRLRKLELADLREQTA